MLLPTDCWAAAITSRFRAYSLIYSTLNNSIRPTKGVSLTFSQDVAGLGGDVRFVRTYGEGHKYWDVGHGFILSTSAEGGWIAPLESDNRPGVDAIRITDRFYLGESQFRGFDIRGLGPRIRREYFDTGLPSQILRTGKNQFTDDSLGGRAYYLDHLEMEIPLGAGARDLGLRPSIFMDAGALFGLKRPAPTATFPTLIDPTTGKTYTGSLFTPATDSAGNPLYLFYLVNPDGTTNPSPVVTTCATGTPTETGCVGLIPNPRQINETRPFVEHFCGNSASPRLSVGFGVNWKSPFGPLRIDIAKALLHQEGEDTKLITFNVGTQF